MAIYRLCSVPFDSKNHVRKFSSRESFVAWLTTKAIAPQQNDCSVIPKNGTFIVSGFIDTIARANYIMYKNTGLSDEWQFAFITSRKYSSEDGTMITIKTDVIQNNIYDWTIHQSFVEREHHNPDEPNRIDENLEIGELTGTGKYIIPDLLTSVILIYFLHKSEGGYNPVYNPTKGSMTGGVFNGAGVMLVIPDSTDSITVSNIQATISRIIGDNGEVIGATMAPRFIFDTYITSRPNEPVIDISNISWPVKEEVININIPSSIGSYTPRNKKLFSYPFTRIRVDNNRGTIKDFRPEYFSGTYGNRNFSFKLQATPGMPSTVKMSPINYKGKELDYSEGITLSDYPQCIIAYDSFQNYIAQNRAGVFTSTAGAVAGGIGSMAMGSPVGITSGVMGIASSIGGLIDASRKPEGHIGNVTNGEMNFSTGYNSFTITVETVNSDVARAIDDFLTMYGEKTNAVKIPNIDTRSDFNYVKCPEVNISGKIPADELLEIKQKFSEGITFWHTDNMYVYS